jgi:hypothetical protein
MNVKKLSILSFLLLSLNTFTVQAAPITYNFTVDNFQAFHDPTSIPVNSIAGSFTLEGETLVAIDLTIGAHTYLLSEVAYAGTIDMFEIGGKLHGISSMMGWSDDFILNARLRPEFIQNSLTFSYTVATANDIYSIKPGTHGSITIAPAVPAPTAAWLFGSGLIGLVATARKRKAH